MELLHNLGIGFGVAFTPWNLLFAFLGAMIGTLIGVLPGIGPIATIAMLLPLTFHLEPTTGLIMLAGIFYGAQYGGSTTAILVNLPGETSAVVTCIDGHQMARQGRAGAALAVAALGSFFAGCISTGLIATFAPPLAKVAQSFGAPEYFSLMVCGLIAAVVLAHGSVSKAVAMIVVGLCSGLSEPTAIPAASASPSVSTNSPMASTSPRWRSASSVSARSFRTWRGRNRAARSPLRRSVGCGRRGRTSIALGRRSCAAPRLAQSSASCRAAARRSRRSRPTRSRRRTPGIPSSSARVPSKAWPAPNLPTMPGRRPRSFRC